MELAKPIFEFCKIGNINVNLISSFFLILLAFLPTKNRIFTLASLYLALGTILMHSNDNPYTRFIDGSSMIFFITSIIYIISSNKNVFIYIGYLLISNIFLLINPKAALVIFITSLIYLSYKLFSKKLNKYYLYYSITFLLIGFIFWYLDIKNVYCYGHAIWHLLNIISIYYLYKFMYKYDLL